LRPASAAPAARARRVAGPTHAAPPRGAAGGGLAEAPPAPPETVRQQEQADTADDRRVLEGDEEQSGRRAQVIAGVLAHLGLDLVAGRLPSVITADDIAEVSREHGFSLGRAGQGRSHGGEQGGPGPEAIIRRGPDRRRAPED